MSGELGNENKSRILVSACLLGEKVRYNGSDVKMSNTVLMELAAHFSLIPCCPELEGGLSVPRLPAEITAEEETGGESVLKGLARVITVEGDDVTEHFLLGAKATLKICKSQDIRFAILTERSPSCGSGKIYDGTFTGRLVPGAGVTAALLRNNGIKVYNQDQLEELKMTLAGGS